MSVWQKEVRTHANVVIGAGAVSNVDVDVSGYNRMTVQYRLTGAALVGDLGAQTGVRPYESDGTTLFDQLMATDEVVAAALTGSVINKQEEYDLSGIDKIQVRVHNAAAANRNAIVDVFLQR